jgi:hypothetical protein
MRSRSAVVALLLAGSFLFMPSHAWGQIQIAGEGRAGVTFPTGDLSSQGAEAGLSLGAEAQFTFQRNVTAYVGLNRHAFSCDSDCDLGPNPRSSGLNAGLKYIFPSPPDALIWGRAGLLANRLSTDDSSRDRNLGFEAGAGIDMPVAQSLYLVPHLGFMTHDAGDGFRANWVTLGLGVHYHF